MLRPASVARSSLTTRRLRLLLVGTHREPGGAASHFVSLVQAMIGAGHEVAVVASPHGPIWRALEQDGRVPLSAGEFRQKIDWPAMHAVRQAAIGRPPDWIVGAFEIDYWGTALVAAERRIPLALFLHHASLKDSTMRGLPWLVRRWVFPSQYLRDWAVGRGIAPEKTAVVYNPVDTTHFQPRPDVRAAQRLALGLAPDDVLVGYVGRLEANKGVEMFAEAMTRAMDDTPNLKALWVGFGTLEADVDRMIRQSPHADRHVRRQWADDVAPYYAAMDVLALPSTGPEAFGRVLVEAQACGVPVLGSAVGGIAETMQVGKTGRLIPAGDAVAWTAALRDISTDGDRRSEMGAAALLFVRRTFASGVIAEEFARTLAG